MLALLAMGLSMLLIVPPAPAQGTRAIDASIIAKGGPLSASEEKLVRDHVEANIAALDSDDPIQFRRARQQLMRPLTGDPTARPSPSFRFAYSTAMVSDLERLLQSGDPPRMITALSLAGAIATERTVQLPLSTLAHEDPSIRYASAYALGLTFQALDRSAPAVRDVSRLIDAMGERLAVEDEPFVLDRVIRTLGRAGNLARPGSNESRLRAIDTISRRVADRLFALDPSEGNTDRLRMLLRAVEIVQASFTSGVFLENPSQARDPSVTGAARLGAASMVYVARRVREGISDQEQRDLLIKIADTGEAIIFFAQGAHSTQPTAIRPTVAQVLRAGDDQGYLRQLERVYTGDAGLLRRAPFSLPPDQLRF